jgi:Grx4 family monothiol glutaredoxin
VTGGDGQPVSLPNAPGIYAIYDAEGALQYVGMSRKVAVSVANHQQDLPDRVHAVAVLPVQDASRDALTAAWTSVVQEQVKKTGAVPPGNAKGNKEWSSRQRAAKPEIRLTPGKGIQDLSVPLSDILQQVVDQNRVVAFVKGTRTEPQCGFSHRVLTLLNEARIDYEVVNVLDEVHNPGLRETIKTFSQWPTIPQLYVSGELVGGADIVNEMAEKGELKPLLRGQ